MLLDVSDLCGGYKGIGIVEDVGFSIDDGETLALLGRNGMGKTTLLRIIAGLADRTKGEVRFNGVPIPPQTPRALARGSITFVPDTRGVFARLTVAENMRLARMQAARPSIVDAFSLFPDLARRKAQTAGTLSGGLQQQVAIGRALETGARLIIIDELTQGLQPSIIQLMASVLQEVAREHGLSLLLVDQNPQLAMSICDRVMVMDRGRIALKGKSTELEHDPRLTDLLVV